mmetsp:Transcript_57616/g.185057  ORF Transcript_57616/g.185057 Transcript_57616/m.185057 type:complete len:214 (-) Transcript_57616:41-682(-)
MGRGAAPAVGPGQGRRRWSSASSRGRRCHPTRRCARSSRPRICRRTARWSHGFWMLRLVVTPIGPSAARLRPPHGCCCSQSASRPSRGRRQKPWRRWQLGTPRAPTARWSCSPCARSSPPAPCGALGRSPARAATCAAHRETQANLVPPLHHGPLQLLQQQTQAMESPTRAGWPGCHGLPGPKWERRCAGLQHRRKAQGPRGSIGARDLAAGA